MQRDTNIEAAAFALYSAEEALAATIKGSDEWVNARMMLANARENYATIERNRALSTPIRNAK